MQLDCIYNLLIKMHFCICRNWRESAGISLAQRTGADEPVYCEATLIAFLLLLLQSIGMQYYFIAVNNRVLQQCKVIGVSTAL